MAYLFDTDAISELWKPRPSDKYLRWLARVGRDEQFTSAVVLAELFKGAFRSVRRDHYLDIIENAVRPKFTVLDFDTDVAREYGRIRADMESRGDIVAELDLQIAATALRFGLSVVTGNVKHFSKVPDLVVAKVLARTGA